MKPNRLTRSVGILAIVLCVSVSLVGVSAAATTLGDHNDGPPAAADGDLDPQNGTGWYEVRVGDGQAGLSGNFQSQGDGEAAPSGFSINNTAEGSTNGYVWRGSGVLYVTANGSQAGPSGTLVVVGGGTGNLFGNGGGNFGGVTCTFGPDQQSQPCQPE